MIIGKCDYACGQYLSTQYGTKCSHIKNPEPFEIFLNKNLFAKSAYGVRAAVAAYKKHIEKNSFTATELTNIKSYMLNNINVIFELFDRRTVITRVKHIVYFALYEAAMRLYEFDNTAFKEIIHTLLDELYEKFRRANSAVYAFIFNFFEDFDEKYHNELFDGVLSERILPADFCLSEDIVRIRELICREENYRHK